MAKKELRIIFMGTPEFAVGSLAALVTHNYNVVGVVTAPDKPAGRGRKLHASAVKKYAQEQGLTILQPTNLKSEEFIDTLKSLNPDLQIVVAFRMLPGSVWELPKHGTINLHASLLPEYRGAAPINWAIINGETKTGVTTFFINEKIDTGEIILQKEIDIKEEETAGTLHDKLMHLGSELVIETVGQIANGNIQTKAQPVKEEKSAPKLNHDRCKINWNDSLDNIYNMIRGLSPYPASWTEFINHNKKDILKIYAVQKEPCKHIFSIGQIITSKTTLKIAVKDGFLIVTELQLTGKKKMDTKSLLNGFSFDEKACVV